MIWNGSRQNEYPIPMKTKDKKVANRQYLDEIKPILSDIKSGVIQKFQLKDKLSWLNDKGTSETIEMTLEKIIPEYLVYKESKVRAQTVRRDKCSLNQLCEFVGDSIPIIELTSNHIEDHDALLQKSFDLLNPNGLFYAEDLISRQPFKENELGELSREIFANYLPNYQTYKSELEKKGFDVFLYQDMSDNWSKVARDRITSYINKKDRHIRVHGKDIVNSLTSFYSFTDRYFSSGKLGGIRTIARKKSTI